MDGINYRPSNNWWASTAVTHKAHITHIKKNTRKNNSYVLRWGLPPSEWFDSLKPFLYYFNRRFTLYLKNNLGQMWLMVCVNASARELPMLYEWFGCSLCCVRVRGSVDSAHNWPPVCLLLLLRSRRIRTFLCMFTLYQNKIRKKWKCVYVRMCVDVEQTKRMTWGTVCISVCNAYRINSHLPIYIGDSNQRDCWWCCLVLPRLLTQIVLAISFVSNIDRCIHMECYQSILDRTWTCNARALNSQWLLHQCHLRERQKCVK